MPLQAERSRRLIEQPPIRLSHWTVTVRTSFFPPWWQSAGDAQFSRSLSLSLPLESSSSSSQDSEVRLPSCQCITFSNILPFCDEKQLLAFNEAGKERHCGLRAAVSLKHCVKPCHTPCSSLQYGFWVDRFCTYTRFCFHGCSSSLNYIYAGFEGCCQVLW